MTGEGGLSGSRTARTRSAGPGRRRSPGRRFYRVDRLPRRLIAARTRHRAAAAAAAPGRPPPSRLCGSHHRQHPSSPTRMLSPGQDLFFRARPRGWSPTAGELDAPRVSDQEGNTGAMCTPAHAPATAAHAARDRYPNGWRIGGAKHRSLHSPARAANSEPETHRPQSVARAYSSSSSSG